jgi:hypothetical protein
VEINRYDTFSDKGKVIVQDKITRRSEYILYMRSSTTEARLVAGGHLTETPVDSVYSSVVRGIRIITFISELNGCDTWSTDISCAYLESYTQEKVYIVAGPEFGARRTLSSLSRRYMAYDPPDYDGHNSLTYYAIWDSSYLKETRHLDARLRRPLRYIAV